MSRVPLPPLSLYIHIPWCVRKCPYCDFNSHTRKEVLPERRYVDALLQDLDSELPRVWGRTWLLPQLTGRLSWGGHQTVGGYVGLTYGHEIGFGRNDIRLRNVAIVVRVRVTGKRHIRNQECPVDPRYSQRRLHFRCTRCGRFGRFPSSAVASCSSP